MPVDQRSERPGGHGGFGAGEVFFCLGRFQDRFQIAEGARGVRTPSCAAVQDIHNQSGIHPQHCWFTLNQVHVKENIFGVSLAR